MRKKSVNTFGTLGLNLALLLGAASISARDGEVKASPIKNITEAQKGVVKKDQKGRLSKLSPKEIDALKSKRAQRVSKIEAKHAERVAKLDRLIEIANSKGDGNFVKRLESLKQKESEVYEKKKKQFAARDRVIDIVTDKNLSKEERKKAAKLARDDFKAAKAATEEVRGAVKAERKEMKQARVEAKSARKAARKAARQK